MTPSIKSGVAAFLSMVLVGTAPPQNLASIKTYEVPLSGKAVLDIAHPSGGTGDPHASGSVRLVVDPNAKLVCYSFDVSVVSEPMMAHIHMGAPLRIGPPVVTLFTGTGSKLSNCAPSTHSQLADINANPAGYYVSLDTTGFPDGALRGQL